MCENKDLQIPSELNISISKATSDPVRTWYEPGKVREIIDLLRERLFDRNLPTYIEFKTKNPETGEIVDIRGDVTVDNIKYLPRLIIHARSDIRVYAIYNEIILPEAME